MFRHDEEEYRRWHSYGQSRGWFDRVKDEVESWFGDEEAEARRDMDKMRRRGQKSNYTHTREENRPYGYMYGSQTFGQHGPIDRWTLGGTEWGAYGTKPADELPRRSHYGRGPRSYQRNDERIHEDVVERLVRHHDIDATDVEVVVTGGEVTLKGMVESRRERRLAEDIVEDVFGVKNVQNLIKVRQMVGLDRPSSAPGEETNPRTKGGIMGTTPGGNNR